MVTPRQTRIATDHQIQLLQGTQEFFPALIADMDAALSDIQFETYIFDCTGAGADVAEALMRAAARGVRVHLVVDGVGTGRMPEPWRTRLKGAGVRLAVYSPLGPLGLLLPQRWRRRVELLIHALVGLFGALMVQGGWLWMVAKWGEKKPMLPVPDGIDYLPVVIAGVLIVLFSIEHIVAILRGEEVVPAWN